MKRVTHQISQVTQMGKAGRKILFLICVLCLLSGSALAQTMTTVSDTIHGPNGSLPNGTITVTSSITFTAADGTVVFGGVGATATVSSGAFSVALVPNTGTTPANTYYSATYQLSNAPNRVEVWVIPATGPTNLLGVRTSSPPAASVMFSVNQMNPPSPCTTGQVLEWMSTADWACLTASTGTVTANGSPVSGNIPKFTTATNIAPAAAADIVSLFSTCSGTQYLGADGACHTVSTSGLGDPGANGIVKRTALNTTTAALAADVVGLFSTCSGTQYLGADGACHAASGSGTVTNIATTSPLGGGPITTTGTLTCTTCATTTNGGALSGTAPIAVSAGGAISGGGLGTVTGALKGNGSGVITQAACADLSNAAASCATDATNASNIGSGTLPVGRVPTAIPIGSIGSAGLSGTAPIAIASTGVISDGGLGTVTGALKGNGSGVITQAAFSDVSGSASCGQLPALTGGVTSSAGSCATTLSVTGLTSRAVTGSTSTDTILAADNDQTVEYEGTAAVAVTLPTPATLGVTKFFALLANATAGAGGALTVTPSTWTVNGASSWTVSIGQSCRFSVDPGVATNWLARCSETGLVAGTGLALVRAPTGLTANVSAIPIGSVGSAGLSGTAPISVASTGVISGGGLGTVTGALKGNGSGTITQAACADLSNAASGCSTAAYVLPNPSASTLGGIESLAAVSHNWINTISTSGVPSATQPADSDLSFTDITTGNASTSNHGYLLKLDNVSTHFMNGQGAWATPGAGGGYNVFDATQVQIRDEFCSPFTSFGSTSLLRNFGSGTGTITGPIGNDANDPCAIRLNSTATASTFISLSTQMMLYPLGSNGNWEEKFRFKLGQTTNFRFYVGAASTSNLRPTDGIWLRYDTNATFADAAFKVETCAASACTVGGTTYTVDTSWHTIDIKSTVAGSIVFTLDANTGQTLSTNVPTVNLLFNIIVGNDVTASAVQCAAGFFAAQITGLTR